MKKLTKFLARFTLFSAAECAILFGLPALATRHPSSYWPFPCPF